MFCQKCGKKLKEGGKFCGYCGHRLVKEEVETQVLDERRDSPVKETRRKITIVTGLLLAFLGIRLIGLLISTFSDLFGVMDVFIILLTIVGVSLKAKWGSILALGYHLFSIFAFAFFYAYEGVAFIAFGSVLYLIIIGLAWKEYGDFKDV